jgi:hypothetical protein
VHHLIAAPGGGEASAWGLLFPEDPSVPAPIAQIFWRADHDPSVLQVVAEKVSKGCTDRFELAELAIRPSVLKMPDGREHVSISDGYRRIDLEVGAGTLLEGPVRLHYQVAGTESVEPQLLTLQRLLALYRLGRFPQRLYPPEARAERWIMMLRACDAVESGASQREIASELFGHARVREEWRLDSDSLRLRVQRLVRNGTRLINGGYLNLLADRPSLS